jgi:hypothetical protein
LIPAALAAEAKHWRGVSGDTGWKRPPILVFAHFLGYRLQTSLPTLTRVILPEFPMEILPIL